MEATIPGNVIAGDTLYTPPKGGPYPSIADSYMDNNNRVKIKDPTNPNFRINKYPGIGHAQGGFDPKVGYHLWKRASDAGLPLKRNPFKPPPDPKKLWSECPP
jgi:hypothetical protein